MTVDEAKKLLPTQLKYPLPDGVIDNLIDCTSIPCRFDIKDDDGTSENLGYAYALLAALIELKERRNGGSNNSNAREDFMHIVYNELSDDTDNCRANRIIDAADNYAASF